MDLPGSIPPSEPTGLTTLAHFQIERLKNTLATLCPLNDDDRENIAAVLKAYRTGPQAPQAGVTTYWYKVIQKENSGSLLHRNEAPWIFRRS
jgi:hypothetical protein